MFISITSIIYVMIGNRINTARNYRKHSQAWLAEEVGVSQSSVHQWEAGKSEPTTHNLSLIAQALSVRFEWLATGTGDMLPSEVTQTENLVSWHSSEEIKILELIKKLPKSKRDALIEFIRIWL